MLANATATQGHEDPMRTRAILLFICVLTALACSSPGEARAAKPAEEAPDSASVATLAGGCFWCVESAFDGVEGVYSAVSGYTGGERKNPTYEQVSAGQTRHLEAVQVRYDSTKLDYDDILHIFWRQIDPTDDGGQFADRGSQYRTSIFYHDDAQRVAAEESKKALAALGKFDKPIVVPIVPAGDFYEAEDYHQDYHLKNATHYKRYSYGSGRTPFLERVWGDEAASREVPNIQKDDLRARLTPLQFRVTQEDGTELPFDNEYWDNKREGIYVDVVSGEPLFSSRDKFKSGTGWPSFVRPLASDNIVEKIDHKLGQPRVELRSAAGDSHLGHVFEDGPPPTGLRYCINSASLRFIPKEELELQGFADFLATFED
jgi:peptide methionine sulfoxide reductase msrA/msrB